MAPVTLVTGATGAVGPQLVQTLLDAGYGIRILAHDTCKIGLLPAGVEVHLGDITDLNSIQPAVQDVESVFHLAALLHIIAPSPTLREQYQSINVDGTANIVKAAMQSGVKRVIFFSTIAVYGHNSGQILTEATLPRPDTFYAHTKLAAEQIVLQAKRRDGQSLGTVLRLGAVYGARVKGNYRRLVQALARGRFIPIGHGRNRRALIHERDVARAALLAAQHPAAAGQIYNVSDGQFHPLSEIIDTICQVLGRRPPRFSAPVGPTRFTAGVIEDIGQLVGRRFPIGRATIDKYIEDVAVDSQRIQRELEFAPQFDLKAGWRETIREMQKNGEL
jgi:UDP-glucose 4-epimerase